MYKVIVKTESGKEFLAWLKKEHKIIHYDTMTDIKGEYGVQFMIYKGMSSVDIKESTVDNLAVEWLDDKDIYLTIGHKNMNGLESFHYKINDSKAFNVKKCGGFDNRKDAIKNCLTRVFKEVLNNENEN